MPTATSNLVSRLRTGDVRALSRAISLVENNAPESQQLLSECFPHTGKALVIGLTGSPGAGKSTLTHELTKHLRAQGKTVGILAVDPTSPYTGGAILGDRIRMQQHEGDSGVYVRSMATRGFLGGLSRATADVATVLEASGKDVLLIETVGVGQDEIDIVRLADITLVMLVPGMGDDVQSIKAGIMEIANIFVVNKADREGVDRVEREIRSMQSLTSQHDANDWVPPVLRTIASEGVGIADLLAAIHRYQQYLQQNQLLIHKRTASWQVRLLGMLRQQFVERGIGDRLGTEALQQHAAAVAGQREDPYLLVPRLMQQLLAEASPSTAHHNHLQIDHLGIAVKSIAEARRFYEALGLEVTHQQTVPHERVHTAMLPLGQSRIELLQATDDTSTIARFLAKRGEGIHHLAVQVPNLAATVQQMQQQGVRFVTDKVQIGAGGHRYVFVHPGSAGGVLIELVEPA